MRRKIGAQLWSVLLVLVLVGTIFVPLVSAEKTGENWIDSFDQWVEPRDMSMYTKEIIIEEPDCTISPEEVERTPGLMVINEDVNFLEPEMEVEFLPGHTAHVNVTDDSTRVVKSAKSNFDVVMKNGTFTWYWIQDTVIPHVVNITNFGPTLASGRVLVCSIEDGYAYYQTYSDLLPGETRSVLVPFKVRPDSVGVKPMGVIIQAGPYYEQTYSAILPINGTEIYNNDDSHFPDPNNGDNLETSDLYHFPFYEGYWVISEAAYAGDNTNNPYDTAYRTMQYVNDKMNYTNKSPYLYYITSDVYMQNHPNDDGEYDGVCDEFATLYTAFTRSLGIPTRFLAFTMENATTEEVWGHGIAESWDGNAWIHSDPTWNSFDDPQAYIRAGNIHIDMTHYDDADDSWNTEDPEDPTGDGILRYEDFRTQTYLGEVPRYN
ncbi:transglutaminase [Methanofollis formosanus]|uniref:Transglutaminase n=2 Tax=Methanofollis formosanus TaxID=299308 RepID=A0A8G1A4S4_9EURY|nr:transglutaminase [Methanofollis formosanus]